MDKCPSGVEKKILHGGTQLPDVTKGSKATFHFTARTVNLGEDGALLDDSRKAGQPMELVFGKQFKLPIWEACLRTMRIGEVAEFTVEKSLCEGYDLVSQGYKQYAGLVPKKPQAETHHCCGMNALSGNLNESIMKEKQDMKFTFELLKVETTGEYEKDAWAMEPEEKLASVSKLREKGNSFYVQKKYEEASAAYQEALGRLEQLVLREKPGDPEWVLLDEMKVPLLLNFSQVKLLEKDYYTVIQHTSTVLEKDRDNVKALFRRAKAHVGVWNLNEATTDFQRVSELDQALRGTIDKELKTISALQKQKDAEDSQKLKGKMF